MHKEDIKQIIEEAVKKAKLKMPDDIVIQTPKDPKWGDYTSNIAMSLAKKLNINPILIAEKIVANIKNKYLYVEVIKPGFINIKFDQSIYIQQLEEIILKKDNFGKSSIGKNKTIIVDYSSPNIAKPMNVGHLRSTIIGQAVVNIYKTLGYKTIGDNYLGDWGTQFGKLIYAYKHWWKMKGKIGIDDMLKLYVDFHKRAKEDPTLDEKARFEFKKLEEGDAINKKIWQDFRKASLLEFERIYKVLGIKFDLKLGEAYYLPMLKNIINYAVKNNIAKKSQGALIITVGDDLPPVLIQKKDGATLYATRDLATIKYREKTYKPKKIIYVIGNDQNLYLKQLFIASKKLDLTSAELVHVNFGLMLMKEGKMSTRAGRVAYAEDLINEAITRARKIADVKNKLSNNLKNKYIAQAVGVGAIKYNDLSQNRKTDIVFDLDKMLSLEGNSAPYIMYTYARAKSILRKAKIDTSNKIEGIGKIEINASEEKILKTLGKFKEVISLAADKYQPNFLCEYLFRLSNEFNYFYQVNPVLKSDINTKKLRLKIVVATAQVIKNGLNILGIDTLEKM